MDDNLAILLLMVMAMIAAVAVIAMSAKARGRRALSEGEKQAASGLSNASRCWS